jgi:tetratricopeptide (TPR) repeat protein
VLSSSLVRLGPVDLGLIPKPLEPSALVKLKLRLKKSPARSMRRAEVLLSLAQHLHAKGQHKRAVKLYTRISREPAYSSFGRMDAVLFFLAQLVLRAKGVQQARNMLYRLVRDHPTSIYVPHVYLAFGEHYMDQKRNQQAAVRLFQQVARYPKSAAVGYAAYLEGRCHLQQGRSTDALSAFVKAVRWSASSKIPARERLLGAARGAMVKAFAQVGAPAKARPFFARVGGKQTREMLLLLSRTYGSDGRVAAARQVQAQAAAMTAPNKPAPAVP